MLDSSWEYDHNFIEELFLTTPPTTKMPIEVLDVRDANPVIKVIMSSSWAAPSGVAGLGEAVGVEAKDLGSWRI